jgi:hypothetical protein
MDFSLKASVKGIFILVLLVIARESGKQQPALYVYEESFNYAVCLVECLDDLIFFLLQS